MRSPSLLGGAKHNYSIVPTWDAPASRKEALALHFSFCSTRLVAGKLRGQIGDSTQLTSQIVVSLPHFDSELSGIIL